MPVPMLDMKAQYATIKDEIDAAAMRVLTEQTFRGGPEADGFEQELAAFAGTTRALGVGSGTDALLIMLKAAGIGPGDEVITTPFTFFATAGALVNAGATPVFADIEPGSFNLSVDRVAALIGPKTKALMPVHLFGQSVDMDAFGTLAADHGLMLFEDNAQALGATWKGMRTGSIGLAGAVSFYPTKNLGGAGEGGAILTSNDDLAAKIELLRCHGSPMQYEHVIVGLNSHLHAMQAAILRVKLRHLEAWNVARQACAALYTDLLADLPELTLPTAHAHGEHVWHQYVLRIPRRDDCVKLFKERSIGCGVYYPKGLHQQECFQGIVKAGPCPETERACKEVIALPIYPELTPEQQGEVVTAIKDHLVRG
jgi:dTDP-4-amino-4,6-dideoxygalactose transaminase